MSHQALISMLPAAASWAAMVVSTQLVFAAWRIAFRYLPGDFVEKSS